MTEHAQETTLSGRFADHTRAHHWSGRMSQLEVTALETHFEVFRNERYPSLPSSEAFERFRHRPGHER